MALATYAAGSEPVHNRTLSLERHIAYLYQRTARPAKAVQHLDSALDIARELHGKRYQGLAYGHFEVGELLLELGDTVRARRELDKAKALSAELFGADHALSRKVQKALDRFAGK